MRATIVSS